MPRRAEPRIRDLATHPRRTVSLRVAAAYLDVDVKTLNKWLAGGQLAYVQRGLRRRVEITEIQRFEDDGRKRRSA